MKSAEDSFITDVPAKSDDAQLVGLVLDYRDAVAHSVAAYRAQVDIITARFSHQKIASAGKSTGDARLVLAKLICGDRSRHAMLRQRDDGRYFENFVDESFVPTALATQRANKADTGIGVNIGTSAATVPDDILEIHVDDRNRGGLKLLNGGFLLPNENLDTWIKGNTGEADSDETQT